MARIKRGKVKMERTLGEFVRDILLAFKGKTYVTMRGTCRNCGTEFRLECYQDKTFPMKDQCACGSGNFGFDLKKFNGSYYSPTLREREEK